MAAPVRALSVRGVLVRVLVVLVGAAAAVMAFSWAHSGDPWCEHRPGPTRVVAFRFAGEPDRVAEAARDCAGAQGQAIAQATRDKRTLDRDLAFVAAYVLALMTACRLANGLVRRDVTLLAGRRLANAVLVIGAVNVVEDLLLRRWIVDDTASASGLITGTVTAFAVTRNLITVIILAFGVAGLAAGMAVIFRSMLGLSLLPQFDRQFRSVADPTREMGRRLEDHPPDSLVSGIQERRFRDPAGHPWRAGDAGRAEQDPVGVCFSGGGIRAASYALGALQGFQQDDRRTGERRRTADRRSIDDQWLQDNRRTGGTRRVADRRQDGGSAPIGDQLHKVRYLATVSGGGYTGTAWQIASRAASDDPPPLDDTPDDERLPLGHGSPEAEWIRRHARFLWPPVKPGTWWPSTLTFLAVAWTALRGVIFNAGLLLTMLFVVSRPLGWLTRTWTFGGFVTGGSEDRPFMRWQLAALTLQVLAVVVVAWPVLWRWWRKMAPGGIPRVLAGVGTTIVAASSFWIVLLVDHGLRVDVHGARLILPVGWCFAAAGVVVFVTWAFLAKKSAAAGFGIAIIGLGIGKLWLDGGFHTGPYGRVELHVVDAVARVLVLLIVALLLLGVLRLAVNPAGGTRAASLGAFSCLLLSAAAMTAAAVTVVWPRSKWWSALVAAPALIPMLVTARSTWSLIGREGEFEGGPVNAARTMVALVTALAGTTLLASLLWTRRWIEVAWTVSDLTRWAFLAASLFLVYAFVDQKWWSPHSFYKRRLAGTFSPVRGAEVDANGKAVACTLPYRIRTTLRTWARRVEGNPELLVCAAAYDTERLRPDENQAVPFVFTADYVGSADLGFARSCDFDAVLGRQNEEYGTLRAAATISGAAVSPALGAVRLASLSQIMAFFNLRLGVWLPSPASINELRDLMEDHAGSNHTLRWVRTRRLGYLLKELVGRYDTQDRFVYVTDGGQFENLGMFELLVRRCMHIYSFDASADKGTVKSVLHSMRMAHERLGIDFSTKGADSPLTADDPADLTNEWRLHLLRDLCTPAPEPVPWAGKRESVAAVAVFWAWYPPDRDGVRRRATVVYCQARIAKDKRGRLPDVEEYATLDPRFPNNSTGDQFIDDKQFDAYVRLGRWAADEALNLEPITDASAPLPATIGTGANGDGPAPAPPPWGQSAPTTPDGRSFHPWWGRRR